MNTRSLPRHLIAGFFLVSLGLASSSLRAEQVLIDTDFSVSSADGKLETAEKPSDMGNPLKAPTGVAFVPHTLISAGKQPLGDLAPPYALVALDTSNDNPDVMGYARISWDLRNLGLETGRYKLSYQVLSLIAGTSGGQVNVGLIDEAGKGIPVHPTQWPMKVFFMKDQLRASYQEQGSTYGENQLFTVEILFDLDKKTWSATANGQPLVTEKPFGEAYDQPASLRISTVDFTAGGNPGTGGGYALAKVRLVKLD